ncbi:hypothetical protein BpHYR1_047851 [Brachionus plicatilis]|uniref:Uncharacterized protein n=1 Tax=Brachionus plicatilis TaxID=10195 RepID=A0A3M7PJQ8_BRAPC|nr:hypothetical protein BpHYR1_047851 [Brachionus plicatilis]
MSRSIFLILIINICMKISICFNLIEHGCSAYDCKRMCLNSNFILPTPGDNGFKLEIEGIRDEKYIPERVYKVLT